MWAIQTGLALASGNVDFLGFRFGPPARVLYLQAEIMDSLLAARLESLMGTMPVGFDRKGAPANFLIQEIASGRPNLASAEGRARVEGLIQEHKPEVLILDPLAALFPGMEENAVEAMGAALDYLSGLTIRHDVAIVLVHHHGKSGASRGSSVFEAWPESDLSASYTDEDHAVAKVEFRLRCAYARGPAFWKMPDGDNLWFEEMPADWRPESRGRRAATAEEQAAPVFAILRDAGPMTHSEAVAAVAGRLGCSPATGKRRVRAALEAGLIRISGGLYETLAGGVKNTS